MNPQASAMATSGKPLSVMILERYRRMIREGLPSVRERLARKGLTISEIARETNTNRRTVRKYVQMLESQMRRVKEAPEDGDMPGGVP